ncbi:MAG TPA: hypothetical protein VFW65_35220 [Pseudonocardiaceae bacterium]|nr:hypothetical protein [Pseudonocardiaceae bacterium]
MSRLRLSTHLTGASAAVAQAANQASSHHWPADLVEATTPLRHLATGTSWLATRLREAADQIVAGAYPHAAQDAASHLPGPMATINDHCRQINAGWESVAAHHLQTLTTYTSRHTTSRLTAPLDTAASVITGARTVAGTATQQRLWPGDWIRATEQLRAIALDLASLTSTIGGVLAFGHLSQPAIAERDATRAALRRIRAGYRSLAATWLDTFLHLDAIEVTRAGMPTPNDARPAIGM